MSPGCQSPLLIQRIAVRIPGKTLILYFTLLEKKNSFYLDNPVAFVYIDINNDY